MTVGKTPLLGIDTNVASTKGQQPPKNEAERIRESRALMWKLKAVVNGLLPESRTAKCFRHMAASTVDIKQAQDTKRCRYGNLRVCGSVWPCPICSRRITEKRREELVLAVRNARANGEIVVMVTQTFSHGLGDDLGESLDKLRKAQRYFTSGRAAEGLRNHIGLDGTIKALEVTYGLNGWHPHLHTLFFLHGWLGPALDGFALKINRLRLKRLLFCLWFKACKKVGLVTSYKHGLDVSAEEKDVSTYIAKWGIESEMTKANFKVKGKRDSVTPWGMLAHIADGGPQRKLYSAKFVEYADSFAGKEQLRWSPRLRARLLKVDVELTDQEIAEGAMETTEADLILASLTIDLWMPITRYNLESTLLNVAENDAAGIMPFVLKAKHRYLQERSDAKCDREGVPREVVPMPIADAKLFKSRPTHNGERLADLVDKDLDFGIAA